MNANNEVMIMLKTSNDRVCPGWVSLLLLGMMMGGPLFGQSQYLQTTIAQTDVWKQAPGLYKTRRGKKMLLVPRLPHPNSTDQHGELSGFIDSGKWEGAMVFEADQLSNITVAPFILEGKLYRFKDMLRSAKKQESEVGLEVTLTFPKDSRKKEPDWNTENPPALLTITDERGKTHSIMFYNYTEMNWEALQDIPLIGHRGISTHKKLYNTPLAFEYTRAFGGSGLELDIVIPMSEKEHPLPELWRVAHPAGVSAVVKPDKIDPRKVSPDSLFPKLESYGLPFLYIDPKVYWLSPDQRKDFLQRVTALSLTTTDAIPWLQIGIAATTDGAASDLQTLAYGKKGESPRVHWLNEWSTCNVNRRLARIVDNSSTDPQRVLEAATGRSGPPPKALAINIANVPENESPFYMGWFCDCTLTPEYETEMSAAPQPLIYWTINSGKNLVPALESARRIGKGFGSPYRLAIMTDFPHRLIVEIAELPTSPQNN